MRPHKGYYSVVQYCPDPSRLEAVNLGVVLYSPETGFLKPRLAKEHARLRKLFGKIDEPLIELQKAALVERLADNAAFDTPEDLRDFIDRRAGPIRLSDLRPMMVADAEAELEKLFTKLVGERPARKRGPRARSLFAEKLREAGIPSTFRRAHTFDLAEIGKELRVEYAYKNGRYNVIEPVDFTSEGTWFSTASARAIEGGALRAMEASPFGEMHMIVVGNFTPQTIEHAGSVEAILGSQGVDLFELDRVTPLLEDIKKHLPLPPRQNA
jgi:hypothetical protein